MTFLPPMLAHELKRRPDAMTSPEYVAEPKMDGERLIACVENGRTVAAWSRRGLPQLGTKQLRWLADVAWPIQSGLLDAEAIAGDGRSMAQATAAAAESKAGLDYGLVVFDVLELDGEDLTSHPLTERRRRLEAVFASWSHPRITLVPQCDDAQALWDLWVVGQGGEGLMLKLQTSRYLPGKRSESWLKAKIEVDVDVVITGVTEKATWNRTGYKTGECGLTYGYFDEVRRQLVTVGQGIKVGSRAELEPFVGRVCVCLCNGVTKSGAMRHGRLKAWRGDKSPEDCVMEVA